MEVTVRYRLLTLASSLALVALACNVVLPPTPTSQPAPVAVPTTTPVPPTPGPTDSPAPLPTAESAEPTPTAAPSRSPAATCEVPDVTFQGVSFCYDPDLATGVSTELLPPEELGMVPGAGWAFPERIHIELQGYPQAGLYDKPRIEVYPIEPLEALSPNAAELIAELRSILRDRPDPDTLASIPVLPPVCAAQVFHARTAYLALPDDGTAIRFLTTYAQDTTPIINETLTYSVQGISGDGRHYISISMPVAHSDLRQSWSDFTAEEHARLSADYQAYLDDVIARLEAGPSSVLTPDLALLDALVQSLRVP